ncbi:MAG: aminoacyl-tRNA hydrolase [Planctomycetales bacterium]|nr:aminoacyl-tRNA hydrolase [Planctomycetales bacterium]
MENAKLVVGLGNPGPKYEQTRHNVGFSVLNALAQRFGGVPKSRFDGQFTCLKLDDGPLILVWPLTYMNLSGRCVAPFVNFYKIPVQTHLLVVCDDLSLPLGKLRLRPKGSAGGQKGLADILRSLGTQEVPRLRIGINPTPPGWDTADYVLSRFTKPESEIIASSTTNAVDGILQWHRDGIDKCMNTINQ